MNRMIDQKTQELAFALLRIAAHIRRFELRQRIEKLSYNLIENIAYQNPEISLSTIEAIRNFVTLGKNVYEIEPVNAKILDRELEQLGNSLRHSAGNAELPDLETMFTKQIVVKQEKSAIAANKPKKSSAIPKSELPEEIIIPESEIRNEEVAYSQLSESGNEEIEDGNSAIRKEKIFLMISTAPERRLALKEVVAAFPEVSERTIRYDLKKLADEGRLIRQGSGGPSSYYMVKSPEVTGV